MSDEMQFIPEQDDRQLQEEMAEMAQDPAYQYWLDAREDELSEMWNREVWGGTV